MPKIIEFNVLTGAAEARDSTPGELPNYPNPVPESVSPIQALTALDNAGLLATLDAYMQDPATPLLVRRSYVVATEWRRDSALIAGVAEVLGLTDEQIDALFLSASQIEV